MKRNLKEYAHKLGPAPVDFLLFVFLKRFPNSLFIRNAPVSTPPLDVRQIVSRINEDKVRFPAILRLNA